ncbi:MAG: CNNM domain-containing protein, partial [Polyangiaceae bacterium]|nr:CNNM domain-containing protein [Polyangiaceae bacterium]
MASSVAEAAATQASMSGNWLGAIGAAVLGAVFAAATSSVGSMPVTRITVLRDEATGAKREALSRYLQNPTRVLSRWLVGRIGCTALTAVLIGNAVRHLAPHWAVPVAVLGTLATYGLLTEISTTLARRTAARSAPLLLRLLRPAEWITLPLAWPLEAAARLSGRLMPPPA